MGVIKKGPAKAEADLTPMIDVTFQLIIFFLLINNIITEEAVEMLVPVLDDPKTQELAEIPRIVVNVAPMPYDKSREDSPLMHAGNAQFVKVGMDQFSVDQMGEIEASLRQAREKNPEVEVLLRADSALHYEEVQPVMAAIANAGIQVINLVAFLPEDGSATVRETSAAEEVAGD